MNKITALHNPLCVDYIAKWKYIRTTKIHITKDHCLLNRNYIYDFELYCVFGPSFQLLKFCANKTVFNFRIY